MADVSIIMTIYNRADTLGEAIDSALAQSHEDFDFIILDDGSADGSLEIARSFAAKDSRIRLFEDVHRGRIGALLAAVAHSESRYFGILDSDDRLAPDALARTLPIMAADPDISVVYTDHQVINQKGEIIGRGKACDIPYSVDRLLVDQMVFHFRLFNREIYDEAGGFDPTFDSAEDYDLVIRMSELGDIIHVPEVLYDYRIHEKSLSVEGDYEQIQWSARAVENALKRRGVADKLRLHVRLNAQFTLVKNITD